MIKSMHLLGIPVAVSVRRQVYYSTAIAHFTLAKSILTTLQCTSYLRTCTKRHQGDRKKDGYNPQSYECHYLEYVFGWGCSIPYAHLYHTRYHIRVYAYGTDYCTIRVWCI